MKVLEHVILAQDARSLYSVCVCDEWNHEERRVSQNNTHHWEQFSPLEADGTHTDYTVALWRKKGQEGLMKAC